MMKVPKKLWFGYLKDLPVWIALYGAAGLFFGTQKRWCGANHFSCLLYFDWYSKIQSTNQWRLSSRWVFYQSITRINFWPFGYCLNSCRISLLCHNYRAFMRLFIIWNLIKEISIGSCCLQNCWKSWKIKICSIQKKERFITL